MVSVNRRGQRAAIVIAIAIAIGIYAMGNILGRVTERAVSSGETDSAQPAAESAEPKPTDSDQTGQDPAGADADTDEAATASELTVPAADSQPITGPGQPPLPMSGNGPHGTWRTTGAKYAALTFDDGPDPRWTPEVLKLLREHSVKATFCVVGQLVAAHPELVRDIAKEGHTLCNHTWSHDVGLGSQSRSKIRDDLVRTNQAIRDVVPAARVSYYRQPGGAWTERVVEVAQELGMSSLHWDVDPRDWAGPGASAISGMVSAGTDAGAIVLLHDGGGERQATVRALGRFLPELADRVQLAALPPGIDPPRRHGFELPLKPSQH